MDIPEIYPIPPGTGRMFKNVITEKREIFLQIYTRPLLKVMREGSCYWLDRTRSFRQSQRVNRGLIIINSHKCHISIFRLKTRFFFESKLNRKGNTDSFSSRGNTQF